MLIENMCVTDELIRGKAERIMEILKQNKVRSEKIEIHFSNIGLQKLGKRKLFGRCRSLGESAGRKIE